MVARRPMIGLAMIADARDAREVMQLSRALDSVAACVDGGVVVLDDRSCEAAVTLLRVKGFVPHDDDEVAAYRYVLRAWDDDFGAARRVAQDLNPRADWLVVLDRDEWMNNACEYREAIYRADALGAETVFLPVVMHNDAGGTKVSPNPRAYINNGTIRYVYAGHNQLHGYTTRYHCHDANVETSYAGLLPAKAARIIPILTAMLDSADPDEVAHAHRYLARTYVGLEDHDKTVPHAEAALSTHGDDPGYVKVWSWLASAKWHIEGPEAACRILAHALDKHPDCEELQHMMGSAWLIRWGNQRMAQLSGPHLARFTENFMRGAQLLDMPVGG